MAFSEFTLIQQIAIIVFATSFVVIMLLQYVISQNLIKDPAHPPNSWLPPGDMKALRIWRNPKKYLNTEGLKLFRIQRAVLLIATAAWIAVVLGWID